MASKALEWGTQKADSLGLELYLDASKMGRPLYETFGWIAQVDLQDEKANSMPMLRPKKK